MPHPRLPVHPSTPHLGGVREGRATFTTILLMSSGRSTVPTLGAEEEGESGAAAQPVMWEGRGSRGGGRLQVAIGWPLPVAYSLWDALSTSGFMGVCGWQVGHGGAGCWLGHIFKVWDTRGVN